MWSWRCLSCSPVTVVTQLNQVGLQHIYRLIWIGFSQGEACGATRGDAWRASAAGSVTYVIAILALRPRGRGYQLPRKKESPQCSPRVPNGSHILARRSKIGQGLKHTSLEPLTWFCYFVPWYHEGSILPNRRAQCFFCQPGAGGARAHATADPASGRRRTDATANTRACVAGVRQVHARRHAVVLHHQHLHG
jgi:hypothetical protein